MLNSAIYHFQKYQNSNFDRGSGRIFEFWILRATIFNLYQSSKFEIRPRQRLNFNFWILRSTILKFRPKLKIQISTATSVEFLKFEFCVLPFENLYQNSNFKIRPRQRSNFKVWIMRATIFKLISKIKIQNPTAAAVEFWSVNFASYHLSIYTQIQN